MTSDSPKASLGPHPVLHLLGVRPRRVDRGDGSLVDCVGSGDWSCLRLRFPCSALLVLQERAQAIELRVPEFLVALEPLERALQRASFQLAAHHAAGLRPLDEARILQNAQMLDDARQRHAERLGQFAHRALALAEPDQHGPARRVGERAEDGVEPARRIVNHKVKCCAGISRDLSSGGPTMRVRRPRKRGPGGKLSTTARP